jgi:hypothetical protein
MLVLEAMTWSEIERRASTYVSADLVPEATEQVSRKWVSMSIAALRESLSETGLDVNGPDLFAPSGLVPPASGEMAEERAD